MNVFVAGGSGTIGVPLVRGLVARNHRVFATIRSPAKQAMIRSLGATPVLIDALDVAALERAVRDAAPTHVVHELTALPRTAPRSARDLEPTNRLREEGNAQSAQCRHRGRGTPNHRGVLCADRSRARTAGSGSTHRSRR